MREITETRSIPVAGSYEVVVLGGGIAGVAASLAARRLGSRVLLVEKSAMLGGLATLGLINYYEPLCDGEGWRITSGLAEALLKLSIQYGYRTLPDAWSKGGAFPGPEAKAGRYATVFSPGMFSLALNHLLHSEGIDIRYDMIASSPVMDGSRCGGVIVESKSGREFFEARMVIDATGDADILFRAGVPCRTGQNYLTYTAHGCTANSIQAAATHGDLRFLRDGLFWAGSDLNGKGHPEGMKYFTGITNEEVSEFIRTGQSLLFERLRALPPGERDVLALPGMAQFRKTRCLIGQQTLADANLGDHFPDSIGATGDFRKAGPRYEIPYGCLFHPAYDNLLAAGRCVSAEGDGWEITRVIPTAALTGEAAGITAALCLRENASPASLPVSAVQDELLANGVTLSSVRPA